MKPKILFLSATALFMAGTVSQAQTVIAGSDMETWRETNATLSLEAPNDWNSVDSLINALAPFAGIAGITITPQKMLYKSTDAYEGTFAAEVKTQNFGDTLGNIGGILTNSQISVNMQNLGGDIMDAIGYNGGTNVTGNVAKVNAWVKTDAANTDNSTMSVMAIKNSGDTGIIVAEGNFIIPKETTTYTNVEITLQQIVAGETPDRLVVLFSSSDMEEPMATENNSLKVDDVTYTMATTGITKPLFEATNISVYPNPAKGRISFQLNANEKPENYALTVMDMNGRILSTESLKNQTTTQSISNYASGTYFYNLTNVKSKQMETGKFIVK